MQLVMLDGINKEEFLASLDIKEKEREQQESVECEVEIFNPMPMEVVDTAVSEKLAEWKKAKTKKAETETVERKKFRNAVTFTDIPATIKKAGFHPDGSPKMAVSGIFDNSVELIRDEQFKYRSGSLTVILGDVVGDIDLGKGKYLLKDDVETKKAYIKNSSLSFIAFVLNFVSIIVTVWNGTEAVRYFFTVSMSEKWPLLMFCLGFVAPAIAISLIIFYLDEEFVFLLNTEKEMIKVKTDISTKVPQVPESVLSKITGRGPFAILFEVTEGWKEIEPDPVIFRVINIGDSQFFEPVVGYDMTPLEKKSLVEKAGINS